MTRFVGTLRRPNPKSSFILFRERENEIWVLSEQELKQWQGRTIDYDGVKVTFELSGGIEGKRPKPIDIIPLEYEKDKTTLRILFESFDYWKSVFTNFIHSLDKTDRLIAIANKLASVNKSQDIALLLSIVSDSDLLLEESAKLRHYISHQRRWNLIQLSSQSSNSSELTRQLVEEVPKQNQNAFWNECPDSISICSAVFQFASKEGRVAIIKRSYLTMTTIPSLHHPKISLPAKDVIAMLDVADRELASKWTKSDVNSDFYEKEFAKKLCARAAEKATAEIFRHIGYHVADIALQQLTDGDDWITHDILLDGEFAVDVKNSRTTVNNRTSYVEHAVPRFKLDRSGENVFIAGMISPYLSYEDIQELTSNSANGIWHNYNQSKQFLFLGVTTHKTIKRLESEFMSSILHLDLMSDDSESVQGAMPRYVYRPVIPPWSYDMPHKFYAPLQESFRALNLIPDNQIPSADNLIEANLRPPFGLFLAARRQIPNDWLKALKSWQCGFLESLQNYKNVSIPFVYLSLLRHFIDCVQNPPPEYNPEEYVDLIFYDDLPAGRIDPLDVIRGLITNLSRVWSRRKSIGLHEFSEFRYRGLGILRGRRSTDEDYVTLIAYCGGTIKDKGKCGYNNLVLGGLNISVCPSCNKLICPKCGHCDHRCVVNSSRQEKWKPLPTEDNDELPMATSSPPDYIDLQYGSLIVPGEDDLPF